MYYEKAITILKNARSKIDNGWSKGAPARDSHRSPVCIQDNTASSFSIIGAIARSMGLKSAYNVGGSPENKFYGEILELFREANCFRDLIGWNNSADVDLSQVLTAFDRTIEYIKQRKVDMTPEEKIVDTLTKAKDLIHQGWCRESLAEDKMQNKQRTMAHNANSFSIAGAVCRVLGLDAWVEDSGAMVDNYGRPLTSREYWRTIDVFCEANNIKCPTKWNDSLTEEPKSMVLDAFDKAIKFVQPCTNDVRCRVDNWYRSLEPVLGTDIAISVRSHENPLKSSISLDTSELNPLTERQQMISLVLKRMKKIIIHNDPVLSTPRKPWKHESEIGFCVLAMQAVEQEVDDYDNWYQLRLCKNRWETVEMVVGTSFEFYPNLDKRFSSASNRCEILQIIDDLLLSVNQKLTRAHLEKQTVELACIRKMIQVLESREFESTQGLDDLSANTAALLFVKHPTMDQNEIGYSTFQTIIDHRPDMVEKFDVDWDYCGVITGLEHVFDVL